ncbi:unnamed protein product, partial [Linum tenue]
HAAGARTFHTADSSRGHTPPLGGFLLLVAGLVFAATLIGLAVATPVFVICSPVIVPAALAIGMAVMGFLTSGAFRITALSWMANYICRTRVGAVVPEQMELRGGPRMCVREMGNWGIVWTWREREREFLVGKFFRRTSSPEKNFPATVLIL